MTSNPTINMDELLSTFEWVSAGGQFENQAYVSRIDGKIYWDCDASDDELPDDIEDGSRYVMVPHSTDLDLGSRLAIRFARRHLSVDDYETVIHIFHRRGAFQAFKHLLDRIGQLQRWYTFRDQAQRDTLREWCEDNGLLPPTERDDDEPDQA